MNTTTALYPLNSPFYAEVGIAPPRSGKFLFAEVSGDVAKLHCGPTIVIDGGNHAVDESEPLGSNLPYDSFRMKDGSLAICSQVCTAIFGEEDDKDYLVRIDNRANRMSDGDEVASTGDAVRWIRSAIANDRLGRITDSDWETLELHNFKLACDNSVVQAATVSAREYLKWLLSGPLSVCEVSNGYVSARFAFTQKELATEIEANGINWLTPLHTLNAVRNGSGFCFYSSNPTKPVYHLGRIKG